MLEPIKEKHDSKLLTKIEWNYAAAFHVLTGIILAGDGAAIPTKPLSEEGLERTTLSTLLPKIHCQNPASFSGR